MDQLKTIGHRAPGDEPIQHLKPKVDPSTLSHRNLLDGPFWQRIPAYQAIDELRPVASRRATVTAGVIADPRRPENM